FPHAFDWALVAISFPRSCVEFMRDAVALRLADAGKAFPLGQVLAQQAVEVLVAAAFPWAVWIGEIATYAGRLFDGAIPVELGAVVPGDGLEGQAAAHDQFGGRAVDRFDRPVRQPDHEGQSGGAFDERQQAGAFADGADHGVPFPVPDLFPGLDGCRPGVDHGLAIQLSPAFGAERPLSASLAALAQATSRCSAGD